MRFATIGDNCIDRYLPATRFVGGNALNVAVQLRQLGHSVEYFGAVGDDRDGRLIRECLAAQGVGIAGLRVISGQTTARTDIATDLQGERRFVFEDFGACQAYRAGAADLRRMVEMDHVHIGWLADGGAVREYLSAARISVSQDLSVNNAPQHVSPAGLEIAFASAAAEEAEALIARLLGHGARRAVVTLGSAGSLASDGGAIVRADAETVVPLDTTGAGDAFIAGFLDRHHQGGGLAESLRAGAVRGRLACLHPGGFPQLPFMWAG